MIELSDVVLQFPGTEAPLFNHFSLSFADGKLTAIMGVSGTGKTTILNCIAGIIDTAVMSCRSRTCDYVPGYVFQEPRLLPWNSVLSNVALPLYPVLGKHNAAECARQHLKDVGMNAYERTTAGCLSGGERQRVSIARALAWVSVHSSALLLDEPFACLDFERRCSVMALIKTFVRKNAEAPAILVTHDPREALFLADRIVVIGGRPLSILYDGSNTPCDVFGSCPDDERKLQILVSE